jgi:hypothetical protein
MWLTPFGSKVSAEANENACSSHGIINLSLYQGTT